MILVDDGLPQFATLGQPFPDLGCRCLFLIRLTYNQENPHERFTLL
jgi:hypothetical protein